MNVEFIRSETGAVTIKDEKQTHLYSPRSVFRIKVAEGRNNFWVYANADDYNEVRHSYSLSDTIAINGDPFAGTIDELLEALDAEIFFLDEGDGSGTPITGAQIVTKLEALEGDDRLDASAIKNLPDGDGTSIARVATFADIGASTTPRIIIVLADETESGSPKVQYIHDGTSLHKIAILLP